MKTRLVMKCKCQNCKGNIFYDRLYNEYKCDMCSRETDKNGDPIVKAVDLARLNLCIPGANRTNG